METSLDACESVDILPVHGNQVDYGCHVHIAGHARKYHRDLGGKSSNKGQSQQEDDNALTMTTNATMHSPSAFSCHKVIRQ